MEGLEGSKKVCHDTASHVCLCIVVHCMYPAFVAHHGRSPQQTSLFLVHHNRGPDAILRVFWLSSFRTTRDHQGNQAADSVSAASALLRTFCFEPAFFFFIRTTKQKMTMSLLASCQVGQDCFAWHLAALHGWACPAKKCSRSLATVLLLFAQLRKSKNPTSSIPPSKYL